MGSSPLSTILLIALMVVAFYFLLLRPQKKRQQAQQKTQNEIQPGTRVLLGSGIFGTVVSVGEKQAILETTPGVQVTVLKQAIARVVRPGDEYSEPEDLQAEDLEADDLQADSLQAENYQAENYQAEVERDSVVDPEPIERPSYENPTPGYENEPKKD